MKHITYATALVVVLGCGAPTSREELLLEPSGAGGNDPEEGTGGFGNAGSGGAGGALSNLGGSAKAAGGMGGVSSGGSAGGGSGGLTMTGGSAGAAATGGAAGATMTGGMTGGMATGGAAGATMSGGSAGTTTSTDPARFNFETTTQGWVDTHNKGGVTLSLATTPVFAGGRSLAVQINSSGAGAEGAKFIGIRQSPPSGVAGTPMKFRVWVPAAATIKGVQPYVMVWDPVAMKIDWNGAYRNHTDVPRDSWYEIGLAFPDTAGKELYEIGVEFTFQSPWQGTMFIDAVHW